MKLKKALADLRVVRAGGRMARLVRVHSGPALAIVGSYLVLFLILFFSTRGAASFSRALELEAGMVVPEEVIAERDVVYTDERATALKREARLKLVPPVFQLNSGVAAANVALYEEFREILVTQLAEAPGREALATVLESAGIIGKIQTDELALLGEQTDIKAILDNASILLRQIVYDGVFSAQDLEELRSETATAGAVALHRDGKAWQEIPVEEIQSTRSLQESIQTRTQALSLSQTARDLVVLLVTRFAEENAFYDVNATQAARDTAGQEVTPVLRSLVQGQVIARRGDVATEETLEKVRAHGQDTLAFNVNSTVGTAFFLALVYGLALYLLRPEVLGQRFRNTDALLLVGLTTVYLAVAALLVGVKPQLGWLPFSVVVPTAVFSMVVTILLSRRVGIVFSLLLALLVLLVDRMNVSAFLFAFLSGVVACAVIHGAASRIDLIRAGLVLSLCNTFILVVQGFVQDFRGSEILQAATWGVANGFGSGFLTLGLLPILEHLLNAPTRFRLMELSDLNAPIFKKMLNMAPGTYNHSLNVANLSESACQAVGANALLARVGAYYHDIGKIDQAEYFIENQTDANKHDNLKPSLSASIIKSHVKIGIEKGRELGLPPEVVDFIAQHHGKAVISYFYARAQDEDKHNGRGGVSSEDYSYPGERPDTRETAVVMLADAVEATTRTLRKPTVAKLEKTVWEIILDRFHSGELSGSSLTFNDLETIKQSFVQVLAGHFHSRIEYPKKKAVAR